METQMKLDGEKIKNLRELRGWSQEQLASAAGVSVRTVQRAESDGSASRETRVCLAAALDVPHTNLEAQLPDPLEARRSPVGVNTAVVVHGALGSAFLLSGLGVLGGSLLVSHDPASAYIGAFFALTGTIDLFLAQRARKNAGTGAKSVAERAHTAIRET
jgi:transcriptional regulator with XRE-family HTH domain